MSALFYAAKDLNGNDIKKIPFYGFDEMEHQLESIFFPINVDIVYLIAIGDEILVTDNVTDIDMEIFWHLFNIVDSDEIHVQEYESYEEAYKVALEMKEESPLCYKK